MRGIARNDKHFGSSSTRAMNIFVLDGRGGIRNQYMVRAQYLQGPTASLRVQNFYKRKK